MADRQRVEEASRKRGRKISPELIEEILGALGPSVIKAVAGVPKIFISSTLSGAPSGSLGRFPTTLNVNEALEASGIAGRRIQKRANIDRPNTIAGGERRVNVGGQKPPEAELEALALSKQKAQRAEKGIRATRKEGFKQRTEFTERFSKLSGSEKARFNELRRQLLRKARRDIDDPRRRILTTQDILNLLDSPDPPPTRTPKK